MDDLDKRTTKLESQVEQLQKDVLTIGKANYPLYIAGVSLSITLVAAILYPFVQNIRKLEESDKAHAERTARMEAQQAVNAARLEWMEKEIVARTRNEDYKPER